MTFKLTELGEILISQFKNGVFSIYVDVEIGYKESEFFYFLNNYLDLDNEMFKKSSRNKHKKETFLQINLEKKMIVFTAKSVMEYDHFNVEFTNYLLDRFSLGHCELIPYFNLSFFIKHFVVCK